MLQKTNFPFLAGVMSGMSNLPACVTASAAGWNGNQAFSLGAIFSPFLMLCITPFQFGDGNFFP